MDSGFRTVFQWRASGRIVRLCLVPLTLLLLQGVLVSQPTLDILIRNGRVVDGAGSPWYTGDIGIANGRIAAIGKLNIPAKSVIDASNLVVAPGFIDMLGQSEFNILVDNRAASKLLQGVTTEITGEGASIGPLSDRIIRNGGLRNGKTPFSEFGITPDWRTLGEYFARLETRTHPAINIGSFVGAGGVRDYVIGRNSRPASAVEMAAMEQLVADAMKDGALGLSTSLQYVPDRFASTDEIVELAKVAASFGGIYITHQRSEGDAITESLSEVFTVAERARIPAEIFHLKTSGKSNWGKIPEVLKRIEAARARGLDITANAYPYTASSNPLDACLPLWVREGGIDAMIERLKDSKLRERVKAEIADPHAQGWENQYYGAGGGDGILVVTIFDPKLRRYEGMTLTEIGKELGKDPRDVLMDIVIADRGLTSAVNFVMAEDDVRNVLRSPLVSIGTDSAAKAEDGPLSRSKSHPRGWGSFPRILGKYVREEHLLTVEEAIRKMTAQPAGRVHLADRGILRPGMAADITIFDPNTIADAGSFKDPNHYAVGIKYVIVNGQVVVRDGKITEARPGRVLRGPGYRAGQ
jgi:N-acyl-D-aspartate/D-glutamate deacylase